MLMVEWSVVNVDVVNVTCGQFGSAENLFTTNLASRI